MTISHDLPHPAPARAGNLATTGQRHVEVTERGARLVILIPSYNEEKAIARVVEKTMQVLSRFSSKHIFIFIYIILQPRVLLEQ